MRRRSSRLIVKGVSEVGPQEHPETEEQLGAACQELRRLLAMPGEVSPEALLRVFADPELRRRMEDCGGTVAELRAFFTPAGPASDRDPAAPARHLSSLDAARAGIKAFWHWARIGFGVVDAKTYARRLRACEGCKHYVEAPDLRLYALAKTVVRETKVCGQCGCFVSKKARYASENCPLPDPTSPGLSLWGEPLETDRRVR